jgi:predicted metal-dependent hydrolase
MIYVLSNVDNNKYLVRNVEDKQNAADLLGNMCKKIQKLLNYLELHNGGEDRVKRLIKKFNPSNICESTPNNKYTSYSINKGEKIVMCLRTKDGTDKLIDINTIMFVILHEIAHVMTISIGHTQEFWSNFKFILKISVKTNIYNQVDYSKDPQPYCGIKVTDSPLYNKSIT